MVYLREITLDDKGEILEMIDEINRDTLEDKFEGFRHLAKVNSDNYEDYLIELEHNKNMKLYKPEYEDQTTFVLVDDNNHIYGGVDIRHKLNDNLLKFGGNIGYLIRPSERRKGYGTKILALMLKECSKLGLNKVLVTCREQNIGSAKVIEKNGGIYENSLTKESENTTYRRYWINI
jgi:predicted acetyltransferase